MIQLEFQEGRLRIFGPRPEHIDHDMDALNYAHVLRDLHERKLPHNDIARAYVNLEFAACALKPPRPYQREALAAWCKNKGRGVVVLPTGAGKTQVAMMGMYFRKRSTLVITPTLDLVRQWREELALAFSMPIGVLGGGEHIVENITVSTYDSAHLHMQALGNRFGLVVFDEVHHLPSETYARAARQCLAPFRMGLSATPERSDGLDDTYENLVGPIVYRREVNELSGKFLANYITKRIEVDLSKEERAQYETELRAYRSFIRRHKIDLKSPEGWQEFIRRSAISDEGRAAMGSYRKQREIAFSATRKLDHVGSLITRHKTDRMILFTQDNAMAHTIAEKFQIPIITHKTKKKERKQILTDFRSGIIPTLVTSKVLNEGVDVPEANVGVVISGSGSIREHVQRLGRILRKKKDGKPALLYELVSRRTTEAFTSQRRRAHVAYQRPQRRMEPQT